MLSGAKLLCMCLTITLYTQALASLGLLGRCTIKQAAYSSSHEQLQT